MNGIKILIVDDHAVVRIGLASLFGTQPDMEVVGVAEDGEEAIRLALEKRPDVVVMDFSMPRMNGYEAMMELRAKLPSARVLRLTSYVAADGVAKAVEAGAAGVMAKADDDASLIPAVRRIAAGDRVVSPEIDRLIRENPPVPELSPRQNTILAAMTRGLTNHDMAVLLGIRDDSVAKHVKVLMDKIGAANRAEAVAIALRKHLLKM